MKSGLLLTFEGLDGSGKSTQIAKLQDWLEEKGWNVLVVREPGGPAVSERIRELLLDPKLAVKPMAEMMLFSAARAQLVEETIKPALSRGVIVLCDRFYDSTTAYQGGGRQLADTEWLDELHRRVTGGLVPDRTYLLKLSPDEARARREGRAPDRMESAQGDFYRRVARAYDTLAERHSERIRLLNGTRTPEALQSTIRQDVNALFSHRSGTAEKTSGSST